MVEPHFVASFVSVASTVKRCLQSHFKSDGLLPVSISPCSPADQHWGGRGLEGEEWVEAQGALKEMEEAEEEARELEEAEDLLEYYLQRAAATQSEAERLLAGARDLEESIGVSLSARRFEVCRDLEALFHLVQGVPKILSPLILLT